MDGQEKNQDSDRQVKRVLEALLFVSEKPLLLAQAREVLGPAWEPSDIRRFLTELAQEYAQARRGIQMVEVAEGFQMITDPELSAFVLKLTRRVRNVRLTKPSLETLAIIAYRQPLTRLEIEGVRGVDAGGVLETLLKLSFIRVVGRKETVGRPLLYATTREFLDHFGLKSLEDLPSLEELKGGSPSLDAAVLPEAALPGPPPRTEAAPIRASTGPADDLGDLEKTD